MEHEHSDNHEDRNHGGNQADFVLTRKILELETLYDVGMAITSVLDITTLTDEILTRLAILLDLKGAFLLLRDETDGQLRTVASFGIQAKAILELQLLTEADIFEEILQTRRSRIFNDFEAHQARGPCQHLMLVPLKAREDTVGVLGVMDKESRETGVQPFTAEDERLTSAFANQAGVAVANARLYNHLQASNQRLETALDDLQKAQEHVVQQERLRALGEMASGVVHDVNNAISAILGYTELWGMFPEMLGDTGKVLNDLQTINTAAKDAAHITRRLRGFYRPSEEGNQVMPVGLNDIIPQAVDITHPKWHTQARERNIAIRVETDLQSIPEIAGDDADLREMFINLIFNAVDAMPEGGAITIRTRHEPEGSGDDESRESVVLEFRDTGTGMTEDVRRQCLEPFFSTKGEGGTGMGLAMVFGIIQRHHGTLEIESETNAGTLFRIRFPVPKTRPSAEIKIGEYVFPHPVHALVVDDDSIQRELMGRYLEDDGHTVVTVGSGREALEQFHLGQFDLVITDRLMPEMDGTHLAQAIKQIAPKKPIILISGEYEPIEEQNADVDVTITKPVTLETFRQALVTVIGSM